MPQPCAMICSFQVWSIANMGFHTHTLDWHFSFQSMIKKETPKPPFSGADFCFRLVYQWHTQTLPCISFDDSKTPTGFSSGAVELALPIQSRLGTPSPPTSHGTRCPETTQPQPKSLQLSYTTARYAAKNPSFIVIYAIKTRRATSDDVLPPR